MLTLKMTHSPASDLGYLLHKNPAKHHEFSLPCGKAHVFFSRTETDSSTATLLLDIDPIALVRKGPRHSKEGFSLGHYVNDRPYIASSFLSMAIAKVFRSALKGACQEKPELLENPISFEATIAALPCKSSYGKQLIKDLFEPLGYEVTIQEHLLDEEHPEWGNAPHYTVTIQNTCYLRDLLSHLYVLIPVLDNEKHYWVTKEEIDKLLSYGEGWLSSHPKKEFITSRYLKRQSVLTSEALSRLIEVDQQKIDKLETQHASEEEQLEEKLNLHTLRMDQVMTVLKTHQIRRVADLGCGEGVLLKLLLADQSFDEILGLDVSKRALERAKLKLQIDKLAPTQQKRLTLIQGSLNYTDQRICGYDVITLIEVIEHLDPSRLSTLEYVVFGFAKPKMAIVTTPNVEYNGNFSGLPAGIFRHKDHRFEWTRDQFQSWAAKVANDHGYSVTFQSIGPEDAKVGAPTQMGVFTKQESGQ